ncbi:Uncharacterised protein [Chlamydia trachomatis]|nr:Uncharacterised protein [Chlamydia trachomatis]
MSTKERKDAQGDENGLSTGKTSPYTTKSDTCHRPNSAEHPQMPRARALRKGKHGHDEKAGDAYLNRRHPPQLTSPTSPGDAYRS